MTPPVENAISGNSIVVASEGQVSAELEGEAVILNLNSGIYYGMDPVGARIWELIQEPRAVNDIRDVLLAEYDVDASRCERDLLVLLQQLMEQGLVEAEHGTDS